MRAFHTIAAAAVISAAGLAGAAHAQATNPEDCIAEIGALDVDGDGYVKNTEASAYSEIGTNVDVDNDGRISAEERTVACQSGILQSLRSKGTSE